VGKRSGKSNTVFGIRVPEGRSTGVGASDMLAAFERWVPLGGGVRTVVASRSCCAARSCSGSGNPFGRPNIVACSNFRGQ